LARANSIVNQTFTLSINCAGPIGMGRSIVVDPEGAVLFESADAEPTVIITDLDLAEVARVRVEGTAGTNRVWEQFTPADAPLELPLYDGRINPATWHVAPPVI
jgi:predicted amidohydrolase